MHYMPKRVLQCQHRKHVLHCMWRGILFYIYWRVLRFYLSGMRSRKVFGRSHNRNLYLLCCWEVLSEHSNDHGLLHFMQHGEIFCNRCGQLLGCMSVLSCRVVFGIHWVVCLYQVCCWQDWDGRGRTG